MHSGPVGWRPVRSSRSMRCGSTTVGVRSRRAANGSSANDTSWNCCEPNATGAESPTTLRQVRRVARARRRPGACRCLARPRWGGRSQADYTQTVVDVLCSYLRRPFINPNATDEPIPEAEGELQVRLAAQRLIANLLPMADSLEPGVDLDLSGASLEYFDVSGRKIGTLNLRYAQLLSRTSFNDCEITDSAWFTDVTFGRGRSDSRLLCRNAHFRKHAWFSGTVFGSLADFRIPSSLRGQHEECNIRGRRRFPELLLRRHTRSLPRPFKGHVDLRLASLPKSRPFYTTTVSAAHDIQLPPEWELKTVDNGRILLSVVTSYD